MERGEPSLHTAVTGPAQASSHSNTAREPTVPPSFTSLPPTQILSHCAPNPSLLCVEFQRRDSGSCVLLMGRTLSSNLFNLHGKARAPSSPEHQKHNREAHRRSRAQEWGGLWEGFDYYPIFCLSFLTFWRFWKEQPRLCARCQLDTCLCPCGYCARLWRVSMRLISFLFLVEIFIFWWFAITLLLCFINPVRLS